MADDQQQSAQERTEEATPKRREDARRRGQVPRSKELSTSVMLSASAAGFLLLGSGMVDGLSAIMRRGFTVAASAAAREAPLWDRLTTAIWEALGTFAPFIVLLLAAAFFAPLALGGWAVSTSQFEPKFERIDPIKGLGRVFSWRGLMEMVKALAKFALITSVALGLLWLGRDRVLGLGDESLAGGMRHTAWMVTLGFLLLSASTLLIAAIDVPFQLWSYAKQLRMTRQELKDEFKHTEGHPEVKGRIRALQREIAQRRMMEEVPEADVVVTNPTHYAVALRYDAAQMAAPRVVAKGAGPIAARIREIAAASGVAVLRSPGLARAVYFSTEIDDQIPVGLYKSVARVLAWALRLREAHPGAWPSPPPSEDDIPAELQVPADADPRRRRGGRR